MKRRLSVIGLMTAILILSAYPALAQLAPNDSTVASSLKVWLTDPANTYDAATGVWTDSSGNGNSTGLSDAPWNNPLSLATSSPASGLFSGQSIDVVQGTGAQELLRTPSLNGGTGFSDLTIIALYSHGNSNSNDRPVGIGAFDDDDLRPAVNLAADGSIRRDNGSIAGSSAPPNHLFIRGTRLDGDGVANAALKDFYFDDTGGGFTATTNIDGSFGQVETADDRLYVGDLRDNYTGDEIAQVAVYDAALTDQQIADIALWMSLNPNSANQVVPEPASLAIWTLIALALGGCGYFQLRRKS